MNIRLNRFIILTLIFLLSACYSTGSTDTVFVLIKTNVGDIKVKLYNETPLHRDNFLKLVNTGFYEGISFHRVINEFMIQAGDPLTKSNSETISDSLKNYTIPAEFDPSLFHKKGALAAARQGNEINPYMRSSGTQFYLVQGKKYTDNELNNAEIRINSLIKQGKFNILVRETADSLRSVSSSASDAEIQEIASRKMFNYLTITPDFKYTPEQRIVYTTIGGTPRLDGSYTLFGEVVEGLDVVDRIAAEKTDQSDKPLNNITILKMKVVRK
ncbi:MAG TPA: peptidylprolyl isomerase [Bacteroidales bacterium]|nr:peptidylprolyl isomerase [Bacteroidales bacterium]